MTEYFFRQKKNIHLAAILKQKVPRRVRRCSRHSYLCLRFMRNNVSFTEPTSDLKIGKPSGGWGIAMVPYHPRANGDQGRCFQGYRTDRGNISAKAITLGFTRVQDLCGYVKRDFLCLNCEPASLPQAC